MPILDVQLNAEIALGAKIAMLRVRYGRMPFFGLHRLAFFHRVRSAVSLEKPTSGSFPWKNSRSTQVCTEIDYYYSIEYRARYARLFPNPSDNDSCITERRSHQRMKGGALRASIFIHSCLHRYQGSGEEDEEGNPVLPEIDDRFLTVGQRLKRLRDARDGVQREKHRAYIEYRFDV